MINNVRNTVLSLLNKENRGYITPEQFNSYAAHAQQSIFNLYFVEYARMISLKNARRLGSDYADRVKELESAIETFTVAVDISKSGSSYPKPLDMYKPLSIRYNDTEVVKIPLGKETFLSKANLTAPSENYPVYVDKNNVFTVKPSTIVDDIELVYVRNPKSPKWTYNIILDEPVFNPSASDYQDFELGQEDMVSLVIEICRLAGLTIRDADAINVASQLDAAQTQKENL